MHSKSLDYPNVQQEDLRAYNSAYKNSTVFLALHLQCSAHSNAVLDDSFNLFVP